MACNDLISIIVPVYNVAPFLQRCVDSICAQTYPHLEIILVDDGSTDGCGEICDRYAESDNRILVLHQENLGPCAARNTGLKTATGQYVLFVDSDDFIHPEICRRLYGALTEQSAQMARCVFASFSDWETARLPIPIEDSSFKIYTAEEAIQDFICTPYAEHKAFPPVVWGSLYKRSLFDSVSFPNGLVYEEGFVLPQIIMQCERLVVLNATLYGYYMNPSGINISASLMQKLDSRDDWKQIYELIAPVYPALKQPAAKHWVKKYIRLFERVLQNPSVDPDRFYRNSILRTLQQNQAELDSLLPTDLQKKFRVLSEGEEAYVAYLKRTELLNKVRGKLRMFLHQ